jgi:ERCC4-related helicase
MYETKGFTPRAYQESIFNTATKANTLICLPTGRGKTKTALLVTINRLNNFPNSKVLFLTPTKPLAAQIVNEFKENSTIDNVVLVTGMIKPEKREELFKQANVIISTPQGMSNDVINKRIDLSCVSLIVFDECHRAVGDYDYVWIAKHYNKVGINSRLVGMSASPGSDMTKIKEVCNNLFIEDIEVRSDNDEDVKPYVQKVKVNYVSVELPDKFKQALKYLQNCSRDRLAILKELNVSKSISKVGKGALLGMQKELRVKINQGETDSSTWQAISVVAQALKIQHAQELLETQGVQSAHKYMHTLFKDVNTKVKATKNLVQDTNFKAAFYVVSSLYELGEIHPKLEKLKEIVSKEIEQCEKILIFTNYRDSASFIKKELDSIPGVSSGLFVGQTKKRGTGLSQKEQIKLLEDFKQGVYNVVIGTSVGEEGIDIPAVDLIVFYEPVPSAIRTVQRRGRTGRLKEGRVQILIAKDTRDEAYRWSAYHKENKMHKALKELKSTLQLSRPNNKFLSSFEKKSNLKVYVDSREKGSGIVKLLVDKEIEVTLQNLEVADFILSSAVGVERKEVKDFVDSILDKRILQQVEALKKTFEKPLIIIEGEEDIFSVRNVHPNAIRGMLSWIAIDMKVPILHTKNFRETTELLLTIARREQEDRDKVFGVRGEKKPLSNSELQEFIVSGLPGVGQSLAVALLEEFKTVRKIFSLSDKEFVQIDKIGLKKSKEIEKIMDLKYKKN